MQFARSTMLGLIDSPETAPSLNTRISSKLQRVLLALVVPGVLLLAFLPYPSAHAATSQDRQSGLQIAARVFKSSDPAASYERLSRAEKRQFAFVMFPATTHVDTTAVGIGRNAGKSLSQAEIDTLSSARTGTTLALQSSRNGVCESGEFCYYYNSNNAGSLSDHGSSLANYGATQPNCYEFKSLGSGKGVCVKNHAASVWNRTGSTVRVYYNSNYGGAYQSISSGAKANLNATLKNNNASHRPVTVTSAYSGCWAMKVSGSGKSLAGVTLYTYGQSTQVCVSGGRVSSVIVYNVWNETSTPGWQVKKDPTTATFNAGWEGRGLAQYHFAFFLDPLSQDPTPCLQLRLNGNGHDYLATQSCNLS